MLRPYLKITVCGPLQYSRNKRARGGYRIILPILYGNMYENTFKEIWEGNKRHKSVQWAEGKLDTNQCRLNCRMDEINRYLWDLKNPPEHVNFI